MLLTALVLACTGCPRQPPSEPTWTPLPEGFEPGSIATAGGMVLVGGRRADQQAGVLEGHIEAGRFVVDRSWDIPAPPTFTSFDPAEIGETTGSVDAALVAGVPTAVVDIEEYQGGSWGHWWHPLGTDTWEFVPNVAIETDIGVGRIAIADGVLFAYEGPGLDVPGGNLWQLRRGLERKPFPDWRAPSHGSFWHPSPVTMPGGAWVEWSLSATPDGRWLAAQTFDGQSQEIVWYERQDGQMVVRGRMPLPLSPGTQVRVTDDWLVVLEQPDDTDVRLSWRAVDGAGPEGELFLPRQRGDTDRLDVRGHQALVVLEEGFVIDLDAGSVVATLALDDPGWHEGVLLEGYAVIATASRVQVFPLK